MSDVLHRPGFLTRLRKGARNFFSRLLPCVRRPTLADTFEDVSDFTSSLSSLSDLSPMTPTEDFPRNLNESAIAHREDFTHCDFDQYERTSFEDSSSTYTDPWADLVDEPSYFGKFQINVVSSVH
ncbi:uncharacterized protein LOC106879479 [Octopus bimaculoides]|uniref:Uncharacterized protein n=1 Tax=Octopus bimaculoides TaxID=37653 RepID=A0A0L8G314_OCTBM|nr:uncharacterized protein LOC106879479 [Octopus bimaculoides]|eukprot:XP_014784555.1 PREDICTED: uncharacterized protein LOC106879479 [Octopus bimaculoides]